MFLYFYFLNILFSRPAEGDPAFGVEIQAEVRYAASRADLEFYRPPEWVTSDSPPPGANPLRMFFAVSICSFVENDRKTEVERHHSEKRNTELPRYSITKSTKRDLFAGVEKGPSVSPSA